MCFRPFFLVILTILICSCGKSTQENALDSLVGDWTVASVFEISEELDNGVVIGQTQVEYNNGGQFTFSKESMNYEYTTDQLFSSSQDYVFEISKENAGFTRVDVFTIKGEVEDFRVRFGDETSDAHEDATQIQLGQVVESDTLRLTRSIELTKN